VLACADAPPVRWREPRWSELAAPAALECAVAALTGDEVPRSATG
jgi:hypothetical protein